MKIIVVNTVPIFHKLFKHSCHLFVYARMGILCFPQENNSYVSCYLPLYVSASQEIAFMESNPTPK